MRAPERDCRMARVAFNAFSKHWCA
jgi:hypothetical protein